MEDLIQPQHSKFRYLITSYDINESKNSISDLIAVDFIQINKVIVY